MARGRDLIPNFPFLPNLWDEMGDRMNQWMGTISNKGVSLSEDDQKVYIEAYTPGLRGEDIEVSLHQNTLVIRGEKKEEEQDKNKKFYRRAQTSYNYEIELPCKVEENSEDAHYQNGILMISFLKVTQGNAKKISIKTGSMQSRIDDKNNLDT